MTDIFAELNAAIGSDMTNGVGALNAGNAEFPTIPDDFGSPALAPISRESIKAVAPINADRSDRLELLVDTALVKAQELLEIELVPGADDFTKIASMQKDLVVSLVNTGVKVDENRFKKRQGDALTGILSQLLEREKTLKPLLDMAPTIPN